MVCFPSCVLTFSLLFRYIVKPVENNCWLIYKTDSFPLKNSSHYRKECVSRLGCLLFSLVFSSPKAFLILYGTRDRPMIEWKLTTRYHSYKQTQAHIHIIFEEVCETCNFVFVRPFMRWIVTLQYLYTVSKENTHESSDICLFSFVEYFMWFI